ncbi:hypothetical protein GCM10023093_23460 [Nemorincola caseinilytica]|uniref:Uncharacterized protein n=2 Tax=Nemorincola caseinilytica TaxID=2054315 RepID=A0ABP8NKR7_9BACT
MALISSCCKKESCLEVVGVPISFYGYRASEVDTIMITGYARGTGFAQVVREQQIDTVQASPDQDSVYVLKLKNSNAITVGALPGSGLTDAYDWQIYIPAVNQTIRISDYGYLTYRCGACGFDKGEDIHSLSTVNVNGASVKVDAVMIYK